MHYEFPFIQHINDVLPAIEGRDEFVVADKGTHIIINYNVMFDDTFLCPTEVGISKEEVLTRKLRRECRGIVFDKDGYLVRRPYHKFKNVNESAETQSNLIDLSRPHVILEKLDGSMIVPYFADGVLIFGTKMGATDVAKPVENFVNKNPTYIDFSKYMIESKGWTPIFEWCSRKQRIILDYPEDTLILTAIRDTETGDYIDYNRMRLLAGVYNIPLVRVFDSRTDINEFINYVHDMEDAEGFVIRFNDGHMLKLKCHWYVQIHRAKEAILQDRNIVEMVLDNTLDDIKANLPNEDREKLDKFESDFNRSVYSTAHRIEQYLDSIKSKGMDRKTFALDHSHEVDGYTKPIVFRNFDSDHDFVKIDQDVRDSIRNNLSRTVKYEAIRDVWFPGIYFNER